MFRSNLWPLVTFVLMSSDGAAGEHAPFGVLDAQLRRGELPGIHGVVVLRDGVRVYEWYGQGRDETIGQDLGEPSFTATTLHDVRSVTKSLVSLLFGIADGDGLIGSLDRPVLDWFPEYPELRTPERLRIRVSDVLEMRSGFAWDEFSYPYTDPRNSEIAMDIAADPLRYALAQPIAQPPSTGWSYSGGDVAIVGAIVARAAGKPLEVFARERLFAPLGIAFEWSANRGVVRAASGLRLTPRDLATLGELVRNDGQWQSQQLVPASWVRNSTARRVGIDSPFAPGNGYGFLWWRGERDGHAWFGGVGNGGQRLWIVPSRGLVIAITAGNYNSPTQGELPARILGQVLTAPH